MMAERDPYSVLGVSKGSTDAEIKRAFRKKARQFHPDRNPDNDAAEAKFKEVQSAYEKISTAEARRQYDKQQQMLTSKWDWKSHSKKPSKAVLFHSHSNA